MYLGKIVEIGPTDSVYDNPQHPYTKLLLSAVPIPDPSVEKTRQRMDRPEDLNQYIQQNTIMKEISPGHFVATLA